MTHRSPLVTLAGLLVAFAVFFGINLEQRPGPSHRRRARGYSSGSSPEPKRPPTGPVHRPPN